MICRKPVLSFCSAVLVLCGWAGAAHAATNTISAIIPWQGQGQIFPVGIGKLRFLGALEGIMYVETAEGAMNEAFVRCPIVQDINAADRSTSTSGNCVITVSPEDTYRAVCRCKWFRQDDCTLTSARAGGRSDGWHTDTCRGGPAADAGSEG
jgi:hypothetical protein